MRPPALLASTAATIVLSLAIPHAQVPVLGSLPGAITPEELGRPPLTDDQQELLRAGAGFYSDACASCHGGAKDGRRADAFGAASSASVLADSPRVKRDHSYIIKVMLHGLTGPIGGRLRADMPAFGGNRDQWVAAVASYVRNELGDPMPFVTPEEVTAIRDSTRSRRRPWTIAELERDAPRGMAWLPTWRVTASHNSASAARAFTTEGWTTGTPQQTSTWFQVELPSTVWLTEIQFESARTGRVSTGGATGAGAARGAGSGAPGASVGDAPAAPGGSTPEPPESQAPSSAEPGDIGPRGPSPARSPAASSEPVFPRQPSPRRSSSPPPRSPAMSASAPAANATNAVSVGAAPGAPATPGQAVEPGAASLAATGFPRVFTVLVSEDGSRWRTVVPDGRGAGTRTAVSFPPALSRFVRITSAPDPSGAAPAWSITNLKLLETGN